MAGNMTLTLIAAQDHALPGDSDAVLQLTNDVDALTPSLEGVTRIDLHFPKFSDGRAYSQAFALRRRRGFQGEIRATGDVLVDQLVQMQRMGFSSAVLRQDQDPAVGRAQFARFGSFYQGDAVIPGPQFSRAA